MSDQSPLGRGSSSPEDFPAPGEPASPPAMDNTRSESSPASEAAAKSKPGLSLDLSTVRVLQRNLVYVIGLSPLIADEEILKSCDFFGQYGAIKKCVVNRNNAYKHAPGGLSYSVYITYLAEEACACCIRAVDGFVYDGREMKASYGTTKYCSYFLKDVRCPKPDCLYLHKLGVDEETFTREDIQHQKHLKPRTSLLVLATFEVVAPAGTVKLPTVRIVRAKRAEAPPKVQVEPVGRPRAGSRYDFVQDESGELPSELPQYIKDLAQNCSPILPATALSASTFHTERLESVLSPTSPDKWMTDVFTARRRAMSEAFMMWQPRKLYYEEGQGDDVVIVTAK